MKNDLVEKLATTNAKGAEVDKTLGWVALSQRLGDFVRHVVERMIPSIPPAGSKTVANAAQLASQFTVMTSSELVRRIVNEAFFPRSDARLSDRRGERTCRVR